MIMETKNKDIKEYIIHRAELSDFSLVKDITTLTINEIYPHYYPKGAVDFFLSHHDDDHISSDIQLGIVYLIYDHEHQALGTITIKDNNINRLFVLPQYQGLGLGRILTDFAEKQIAQTYTECRLDASLSAKGIYLHLGYKEIEYHTIITSNKDVLCYDVMVKCL